MRALQCGKAKDLRKQLSQPSRVPCLNFEPTQFSPIFSAASQIWTTRCINMINQRTDGDFESFTPSEVKTSDRRWRVSKGRWIIGSELDNYMKISPKTLKRKFDQYGEHMRHATPRRAAPRRAEPSRTIALTASHHHHHHHHRIASAYSVSVFVAWRSASLCDLLMAFELLFIINSTTGQQRVFINRNTRF